MSLNKLSLSLVALSIAGPAQASFLDSDFWCRTYGCVVVHDGQTYDIYDNWDFGTNQCCVPYGSEMIDYYIRAGTPNITGTLTPITGSQPNSAQGMMLGITENGSTFTQSVFDDGDGYLDAGDAMSAFALSPTTSVRLAPQGRAYSHSFFISSRNTRFSIRAMANINQATGDFANTIQLGDIKLTPSLTARGNDGGFDFGSRASANNVMIVQGVETLGDLTNGPTQIMDFNRQSIRLRNGDIDEQALRLDLLYEMPQYDFSMGTGSLDVDVTFSFYRER